MQTWIRLNTVEGFFNSLIPKKHKLHTKKRRTKNTQPNDETKGNNNNNDEISIAPPPSLAILNSSLISFLDILELWQKQCGKCYLSNIQMESRPAIDFQASLVRLNASKEYIKENCILICSEFNWDQARWSRNKLQDILTLRDDVSFDFNILLQQARQDLENNDQEEKEQEKAQLPGKAHKRKLTYEQEEEDIKVVVKPKVINFTTTMTIGPKSWNTIIEINHIKHYYCMLCHTEKPLDEFPHQSARRGCQECYEYEKHKRLTNVPLHIKLLLRAAKIEIQRLNHQQITRKEKDASASLLSLSSSSSSSSSCSSSLLLSPLLSSSSNPELSVVPSITSMLLCNLTFNDITNLIEKQKGRCAISNIPLCFQCEFTGNKPWQASLFRINTNKGYELDNILLVCNEFNHNNNMTLQYKYSNGGSSNWNTGKFDILLQHLKSPDFLNHPQGQVGLFDWMQLFRSSSSSTERN